MDTKPLRQEDYQAMAEELRRLKAETQPKTRSNGHGSWKFWKWKLLKSAVSALASVRDFLQEHSIGLKIASMFAVIVTGIFIGMLHDIRDTNEQEGNVVCYMVHQKVGDPVWGDVSIFEHRHGRNHGWDHDTNTHFKTKDEGIAFLNNQKLPVCQ